MKVIKMGGKTTVKISKSEWEKIGVMFKSSQDLSLVKKMDGLDERELTRAIREKLRDMQ